MISVTNITLTGSAMANWSRGLLIQGVTTVISGGFRGVPWCTPLYGANFSEFHAVFHKIWQNHMLSPPGGLAPPPMGNPGSAHGYRGIHSCTGPLFWCICFL